EATTCILIIMKFLTAATLFTLLPALSMACAVYDNCLCQNSDGSFNDDATQKACANFSGNYDVFDDGRHYCAAAAIHAGAAGGAILSFNNCRFRETCNNHGATGDSNCWAKEWA
ncbi:hypothetical protein PtrEW4_012192, partial [Pyrenophora tritici-repentis]